MAHRTMNAKFVDFNGRKYKPDEVDELAKVLPKRDVDIFVEGGFWKATGRRPKSASCRPYADLPDTSGDWRLSRKCGATARHSKERGKHYDDAYRRDRRARTRFSNRSRR
jgi:hypothetical protein